MSVACGVEVYKCITVFLLCSCTEEHPPHISFHCGRHMVSASPFDIDIVTMIELFGKQLKVIGGKIFSSAEFNFR